MDTKRHERLPTFASVYIKNDGNMTNNPVNSTSWRARYIRRGGNEKGLRGLYLMYEKSFNRVEVMGVNWGD